MCAYSPSNLEQWKSKQKGIAGLDLIPCLESLKSRPFLHQIGQCIFLDSNGISFTAALSSPLYQNVGLLKSSPNYPYVDDLPLPPPPHTFGSSTSWSNQQMDNLQFPPPPPEVESTYGSDINGNQFRYDNSVDRKMEDNLYANLRPQPPLVRNIKKVSVI